MANSTGFLSPAQTGAPLAAYSPEDLASLSVEKLMQGIRAAMQLANESTTTTTAALRQQLLPALLMLRSRVPHGEWEPLLHSLGLKPATVRQWCHREREASRDLARLLGADVRRRPPKRELPRSVEDALLKAACRLANAVLANRPEAAAIARALLEACEEHGVCVTLSRFPP